ncbi:DUF488 domain-containing protein [Candidatus Bathyarchaeota archaeon]|nr:DUF488 domain-containing protein [Candidatus Bathyarchaeota archaeon]
MSETRNEVSGGVYSIGYHGKSWKGFLQILNDHSIRLLLDVRSIPRSRHNPAFNLNNLKTKLGSRYQWAGNCLGGLKGKRQPGYWEALKELAARSRLGNICLLCAETNPDRCHRKRWIAEDLKRQHGITVQHL